MQPRETLYHKMMEMAWLIKMMIKKVILEMDESIQEGNKEHKKMMDGILSRLNSMETITKLLIEVEKDQKSKIERLAAQFHLYLCYFHHMDIMPANGHSAPVHIRKTRMISHKDENKSQGDGGKKHIIVLDHRMVSLMAGMLGVVGSIRPLPTQV
jgi:hypothetical protein